MKIEGHVVERWTSRSLKLGVWLSGSAMVAGLVDYAVRSFSTPVPVKNPTIAELVSNLLHDPLNPFTLMYGGLVLLMLTPFLRVLTASIGFAVEKDRRFTVVSLTVFVLLVCEFLYTLYR
ncbi:MAG TPA: DUF1634 domain-containing protein [Bacteroidota bacterium]|nr:DUF1634 domain-containing protein [Bacteroidota bacterium]